MFRTEAERCKFNRSEGARKRSARQWTNWGLMPPGKLAKYGNNGGEGSSSGGSSRPPRPPVYDSSEEHQTTIYICSSIEFSHDISIAFF
jgi:hypothetical protein